MDEIIKYQPVSDEAIARGTENLPALLLSYLERRVYEDLGSRALTFAGHAGGELLLQSRFIEIKEVKHTSDLERSFHPYNMQNVISSLRGSGCGLVYLVRGRGQQVNLYMGTRRSERTTIEPERQVDILSSALLSNYPGMIIASDMLLAQPEDNRPLTRRVVKDALVSLTDSRHLYALTGIPSLRGEGQLSSHFTQSIDILVDALRGEDYSLLVLAEPIPDARITQMLHQLYILGDDIHLLTKHSVQISEGTSQGSGVSISAGLAMLLSASAARSTSVSRSLNRTLVQEVVNKAAQACARLLDRHQERLDAARNFGFWTTGIYIASDSKDVSARLQSVVRSLFAGDRTHFEPLRLLDISRETEAKASIDFLHNPIIQSARDFYTHPLGAEYDTLATPLTTAEVAILMGLPHREVPGLKLGEVSDFNLNPKAIEGVRLGNLLYRGGKLDTPITISPDSLTRHAFVTGLTGSGKTNTCLALLAQAYEILQIKFMVIDPAKTEYSFLINSPALKDSLQVFTIGDEETAPFRLNPFEFVPGFPLLTHIDLLKAVFNAAFPMYASMPYLLEEALIAIYSDRGWDIGTSKNRYLNEDATNFQDYLPRLSDLYAKIDDVVLSKNYDARLQMDLTAALKARLGSLMRGFKGMVLNTGNSIPMEELLDLPVVLQLQRIGDEDEKAFLMALIFIMLYEASQKRSITGELRHVTLIEEAHRLLKNISTSVSAETANPRGKTVEMFSDMLAEMRARGEGFIVVDQIPSKLIPDIVKNSNLKIVHRLLAEDDRYFVGSAMGLKREQIDFLPRLEKGQAIIHSEELEEACFVKIDRSRYDPAASPVLDPQARKDNRSRITARWGDHLRRLPGCRGCASPCTFSPQLNDPTEYSNYKTSRRLLFALDQVLAAILVSSRVAVVKSIHVFNRELNRVGRQRHGGNWGEGEKWCTLVFTATEAVRRFATKYPHGGDWNHVLALQTGLLSVLKAGTASSAQLDQFLFQLRCIARDPAVLRPGCLNCPARCRFGHRFQHPSHPTVKTLAAGLKMAPHSTEEIINLAVKGFGVPVKETLHAAAGYCLLAQVTDNSKWLDPLRILSIETAPVHK